MYVLNVLTIRSVHSSLRHKGVIATTTATKEKQQSRFFVHFFTVTARLRVKLSNFTSNGGRKQATTRRSFPF